MKSDIKREIIDSCNETIGVEKTAEIYRMSLDFLESLYKDKTNGEILIALICLERATSKMLDSMFEEALANMGE
jgi:hypothetical protein